MKAVILCGGQGTRLQDATGGLRPKPLVEVAGRPILWHIMKGLAYSGITEFVLCLGHLGNMIKEYFLHYEAFNTDITIKLGSRGTVQYHRAPCEANWSVTLADTGQDTMTGARLARIQHYVQGERFLLTYGDGVADIDFKRLLAFHEGHHKLVTVTGVSPFGRFGRMVVGDDGHVIHFDEKPAGEGGGRINGGFFVMEPGVFDYVTTDPSCILERESMAKLVTDKQLMMHPHDGFWQCMDTYRDLLLLQQLWDAGNPPWRTWSSS